MPPARASRPPDDALPLTARLLRRWPLPRPDDDADKEERGRVLVVGSAPELPGAVILAATAALRAGAGKLQIATGASLAPVVGAATPEARVFGLAEVGGGGLAPAEAERIVARANAAQTLLVGPGLVDPAAVRELVERVIPRLDGPLVVLDAEAMMGLRSRPGLLHGLQGRAIVTPHAGEMAQLLGVDKDAVRAAPLETARRAAAEWRAVVALKGAETIVAGPDGRAYRNRTGNVGLATSGSGDTLSGIIAGLAARGAEPLQAAAWGVFLHGSAGDRLARRVGPLGFLARELLAEVPGLMAELSKRGQR